MFEKIEESKQQKVSTDIEHLIRTSHIDEGLLIEKEWKTEYLPIGASFGSEVISFDNKIQNTSNLNRAVEQLFIAKKGNSGNIVFLKGHNQEQVFPSALTPNYSEYNYTNGTNITVCVESGKLLIFPSNLIHKVLVVFIRVFLIFIIMVLLFRHHYLITYGIFLLALRINSFTIRDGLLPNPPEISGQKEYISFSQRISIKVSFCLKVKDSP